MVVLISLDQCHLVCHCCVFSMCCLFGPPAPSAVNIQHNWFFDLTLASLCGLCVYFPTFCFLNSNHTNLSGSSTYLMLYVQVERSLAITHRWQFSAHKTVFAEWEVQLRGSPGTRDLGPGTGTRTIFFYDPTIFFTTPLFFFTTPGPYFFFRPPYFFF